MKKILAFIVIFGIVMMWSAIGIADPADGDGDTIDDCPAEEGSPSTRGCRPVPAEGCTDWTVWFWPGRCSSNQDDDGDGIKNAFDHCYELHDGGANYAANFGCPTITDGGSSECVGITCPDEDKDGDGVINSDDNCIDEAGPHENNGCPVIEEEQTPSETQEPQQPEEITSEDDLIIVSTKPTQPSENDETPPDFSIRYMGNENYASGACTLCQNADDSNTLSALFLTVMLLPILRFLVTVFPSHQNTSASSHQQLELQQTRQNHRAPL